MVYGKLSFFQNQRQMSNPVVDLVGDQTGRIIPVYPQSEKAGLHTWDVAQFVAEALRRTTGPEARGVIDPLPMSILDRHDLVDRQAALGRHPRSRIHGRGHGGQAATDLRRLFRMQLALVMRKRAIEATEVGLVHTVDGPLLERFYQTLPFPFDRSPAASHRRDRA